MVPFVVDSLTQLELLFNVKENGLGPPAPMSMKRLPNGTKLSKVSVGGGQL